LYSDSGVLAIEFPSNAIVEGGFSREGQFRIVAVDLSIVWLIFFFHFASDSAKMMSASLLHILLFVGCEKSIVFALLSPVMFLPFAEKQRTFLISVRQ
jgi:hypothetical protein